MSDFIPFEIAKKLKENGFTLLASEIYGKFDSDGVFHSQLYCNYYETMDLDEIIAPTISQVLKWLRDEKKIHLAVDIVPKGYFFIINYNIYTTFNDKYEFDIYNSFACYSDYKQAALAGIKYVLDNLI